MEFVVTGERQQYAETWSQWEKYLSGCIDPNLQTEMLEFQSTQTKLNCTDIPDIWRDSMDTMITYTKKWKNKCFNTSQVVKHRLQLNIFIDFATYSELSRITGKICTRINLPSLRIRRSRRGCEAPGPRGHMAVGPSSLSRTDRPLGNKECIFEKSNIWRAKKNAVYGKKVQRNWLTQSNRVQ